MSIQFKNSFQSIGVKKLLHFFTNYWQWVTTICICHMKIMIHHTTMFFIWVIIRFMVSPRTFSTKEEINHSWPPRIQSSSRQPFPAPCQKKKEIRLSFFLNHICADFKIGTYVLADLIWYSNIWQNIREIFGVTMYR